MKKTIIFLSLTLTMIFTAFQSTVVHAQPFGNFESLNAVRLSQEMIDLLPAGYLIPAKLPSTIRDQVLLAGWVYLYNQTDPLPTWNGDALTGQMFSDYIIDQKVTIRWDTKNTYSGNSCTIPPSCKKSPSGAALSTRNKNPILLTTAFQALEKLNIAALAGTLAHEIFHHKLPFGCGPDTLFEEFWAYSLGAHISKRNQSPSEEYNPLISACLVLWINLNDLGNYANFNPYPPVVLPLADTSITECVVIHRLPGEVAGFEW